MGLCRVRAVGEVGTAKPALQKPPRKAKETFPNTKRGLRLPRKGLSGQVKIVCITV